MNTKTTLHLFGSLRKTRGNKTTSAIDITLNSPTPLLQIIRDSDIPEKRVQLTMVNHRAVTKDVIVNPGDRLALFPKEYPIFADWKNLRSG